MTNLMARIPGPPRHGRHAWHDDDASLVSAAGNGDVVAQEHLWRDHVDAVHRVCASMLARQDAEDAVAETFLAAFGTSTSFDPARGGLQAWLLGIAVNQVRRRWRSERRVAATLARLRDRGSSHEDASSADHADAVIERADARAIAAALEGLAPADRLVLVAQAAGDLSPDGLGAALGCSAGAAKVRLHRARRRLATLLASIDPTSGAHHA